MGTTLDQVRGTACIITGGLFKTVNAKTAHGLIRETDRFDIIGVLDEESAGLDAGVAVDGTHRAMPIVSNLSELISATGKKPAFAIIGMATKGGVLPTSLYPTILEAIDNGLHIVNGLHQPLAEIPEFAERAAVNGTQIHDIRKSKPFEELHFWNGDAIHIPAIKLAVLGTDCGLGKRTTAKLLTNALNESGIKTSMVYTGQTGWLQGIKHGFIFDATPNDFIPGELEHAVIECYNDGNPDVIVLEGQASLRNPSGPCGSEFIISAAADAVILQHHPGRDHFLKLDNYPKKMPTVEDEIALIAHLGAPTWAVTLNTSGLSEESQKKAVITLGTSTGLPVIRPMEDGLEAVVDVIKQKLKERT